MIVRRRLTMRQFTTLCPAHLGWCLSLSGWCLLLVGVSTVRADNRIHLRDGGELAGRVVAEEDLDRDQLLTIELERGGTLKLRRTQISKIETTSPEELAYAERVATIADTPEAHWAMAQWCGEQRLREQEEYHLLQVIKLDPNHEDARHALGYSRIRGRWATRDQVLREAGRRSNGMLFEEFEIAKQREAFEDRQTEFIRNLRIWRRGLGKGREAEMLANIRAVKDPAAIKPIVDLLAEETSRDAKLLWVEVLSQIESPNIIPPLVKLAVVDDDEHVREIALRKLQSLDIPVIQRHFMAYLDPAKNPPLAIDRAGRALAWLGNEEAVRSLIEALVTQHKMDNPAAGNPGAIGAQFGNQGGGSFSFGGSAPKTVTRDFASEGVRSALQEITGVDYQFDRQAWLNWYVNQRTPTAGFDLRRDQ